MCKKYRLTLFIDPLRVPQTIPWVPETFMVSVRWPSAKGHPGYSSNKKMRNFYHANKISKVQKHSSHFFEFAHPVRKSQLGTCAQCIESFPTLMSEIWTPILRIQLIFLLTLTTFGNWSAGYEKPSQKLAVLWCSRYPRNYSLGQKWLGHFYQTLFFNFWPVSSSSQCCLSQLTHQIVCTNIGLGQKTAKCPNNFDWDCSVAWRYCQGHA